MTRTTWDNMEGTFGLEFYEISPGQFADVWDDKPIPAFLRAFVKGLKAEEHGELIVKFSSSGYRDSGSMYGGSDQLGWAPEGSDERTILTAYVEYEDKSQTIIPESDWHKIWDEYGNEIDEIDIFEDYPH
jgi:hypothetical protein